MKYGLKPHIWNQIISCVKKNDRIEEVILYGSRAKGTHKEASDIDLVLKGEEITTKDQLRLENELDDLLLPWKFDVSIFHNITNPELLDHIRRVGVTVYKQDVNLQES
ncbi:MAG: nucleotidyltransferase domain-containing protein [Balneolaceae bacterium]|nr:nucleotidyltransferase domain-containing protein [Balneolaceae bacterium]